MVVIKKCQKRKSLLDRFSIGAEMITGNIFEWDFRSTIPKARRDQDIQIKKTCKYDRASLLGFSASQCSIYKEVKCINFVSPQTIRLLMGQFHVMRGIGTDPYVLITL